MPRIVAACTFPPRPITKLPYGNLYKIVLQIQQIVTKLNYMKSFNVESLSYIQQQFLKFEIGQIECTILNTFQMKSLASPCVLECLLFIFL